MPLNLNRVERETGKKVNILDFSQFYAITLKLHDNGASYEAFFRHSLTPLTQEEAGRGRVYEAAEERRNAEGGRQRLRNRS